MFHAYTDQLAARFGAGVRRRAGNVRCSWYAYYENITETQLAKDVADLAGLPFDVVQIDDGREEMVGDWTPNAKFPSGMRALATASPTPACLPASGWHRSSRCPAPSSRLRVRRCCCAILPAGR